MVLIVYLLDILEFTYFFSGKKVITVPTIPIMVKIADHLKLKSNTGLLPKPIINKILTKIIAIPCSCFFIQSHSFIKLEFGGQWPLTMRAGCYAFRYCPARLRYPANVLSKNVFVPRRPRHTLMPRFICHRQRGATRPAWYRYCGTLSKLEFVIRLSQSGFLQFQQCSFHSSHHLLFVDR